MHSRQNMIQILLLIQVLTKIKSSAVVVNIKNENQNYFVFWGELSFRAVHAE